MIRSLSLHHPGTCNVITARGVWVTRIGNVSPALNLQPLVMHTGGVDCVSLLSVKQTFLQFGLCQGNDLYPR
jgi:hypothetical protein